MEVTAAVSTQGMLWPDNVTDITQRMRDINSTTVGMSTVINNYTTTTEHKFSNAFIAFYFFVRFLFSGFAIFGNTLTIIAVVCYKKLQNNTNYLICNLAIADMIGCMNFPVSLAHDMLSDEPIFVPFCLIHRTLGTISMLMNLFSILGIAIDRYFFIAHGLHYTTWVTSTKIYTIVGITWVFVITEITTIFVLSHRLAVGATCKLTVLLPKLVYWMLFAPQSVMLMGLTIAFYVALGRIAHRQVKAIAALNQPYDTYEANLNRQQKKIAKMMGTVLGAYFACYIPQIIGVIVLASSRTSFWLHYEKIAALLYWANMWQNPLIYAWKSVDFRVVFRKLLGLKPANDVHPLN